MNRDTEPSAHRSLRWRLVFLAMALLALLGLASAWSWSPLRGWLDAGRIVSALEHLGQSIGPVAAILGFGMALTLAVPLTFLTLVAILAFGPAAGFFYSMAAALLGAAVSFWIGERLGHDVVQQLGGVRVNRVSQRLASHGVLSVIAVRMVPIAPFAIVNMIAGASHLSLRDLLIGTAIGMTPGTLVMMFFASQIVEALKNPSLLTYLMGLSMLLLIVGGAWGLRRWVRRFDASPAPESGSEP